MHSYRVNKEEGSKANSKSNSKSTVRLEITGVDLLHNYFNMFLSKLNFFSIKVKDFEDFCFICKTLHRKAHINNIQVKDALLKQAEGMNSARLSTNKKNKVQALTDKEVKWLDTF